MSPEKGSPDIKTNSDLDSEVEQRAHELLVENLAHAIALRDPRFRDAMVARKAAESDAETAGRVKAADVDRTRRHRAAVVRYDKFPYGIEYLEGDHAPEAIFERVKVGEADKETHHQLDEETDAKRTEDLDEAVAEARQLTLSLGKMTAGKLSKAGVPTNTVVKVEHTSHVKGFSAHNLRVHGEIRSNLPVITHEDTAEGWELPIQGQIDQSARVILCADGRILIAYLKDEDKKDDKNVLYVKPNSEDKTEALGRLPLFNRPGPRVIPGDTYSSFVDERTESDIGMSNLPVGSPVARAYTILTREQAMQEAVVSMLVKNDIPVTSEPETPALPEDKPDMSQIPYAVHEPEAPETPTATASKPEALPTSEQIDRWLDEGLVTLHTWIGNNDLSEEHKDPYASNRLMTVYNKKKAKGIAGLKGKKTPKDLEKAFQEAGVDELLTYSVTDKKIGDEQAVMVSYEIPQGSYPVMSGLNGNVLVMNIMLPESEAEKLWDGVGANPNLAGEIAERFMVDHLGLEEWWGKQHPDFEKMREKRGGVRRMAFKDKFSTKPKDSVIKEF